MKVGIIGCGNIAEVHIPFILSQDDVKIVGVCDVKSERARFMARKYNIEGYYSDLDEMFDRTNPDIVHILTSVQTHAALVLKALISGCHVFVEKAMCLNVEEADEIIDAVKSSKRKVCVDHTLIFDPLFVRAREMIKGGTFGEVIHIEALVCDDHLEKKRQGLARQWVDRLPGGILNELLPHPLYVIMDYLPEITLKSAYINRMSGGDLANFNAFFTTGQADASIRISTVERPIQQSVTFHCTNGIVNVDYRNLALTVKRNAKLPGPVLRLYSNVSQAGQITRETLKTGWGVLRGRVKAYTGLQNLIGRFYRSIRLNEDSPVTEFDGKSNVRMLNDIWEHLKKHYGTDGSVASKSGQLSSAGNGNAKILVTGATGFIGGCLSRRLVEGGETVRVLCRESSDLSRLPGENVEIVYGNMNDADSLKKAISGIDLIYHCAAAIRGKWADHYENTVDGTRNLLETARNSGVRKVVYISSTGIFNLSKFSNRKVIDENSDLEEQPEKRGLYVKAKLEAEKLVKGYMNDGKPYVSIIRPGIVYGEDGRKYVADAGYLIKGKIIIAPGSRKRPLHLVYVENLVDAIILAGRFGKSDGKIFNIVDHDQPTVHQYLKRYKEIAGLKPFVVYIPKVILTAGFWFLGNLFKMIPGMTLPDMGYRIRCITHNYYDLSKAKSELSWESKITLDKALRRTFKEL